MISGEERARSYAGSLHLRSSQRRAPRICLSSCSTRIGAFSVASTRNFDFTASANYQVDEEKTVSNFR